MPTDTQNLMLHGDNPNAHDRRNMSTDTQHPLLRGGNPNRQAQHAG